MVDRPEISSSEWQVMNVVWDRQPVTASQVIDSLEKETSWSAQTIRTFLHRLVKKGILTFDKDGNRYLYRAAVSKSATIKKASRSFLSSVFGGKPGSLLLHFAKSSKLSEDEIQQLRELLEQKESQ